MEHLSSSVCSAIKDLSRARILAKTTNHVCDITKLYRVSQEECEILRESVPYVKL